MYLKKVTLFLIIVALQTLSGQDKKIAIYYEGEGYLQPYITNTLDSLKSNQTNDYLYMTTSLNQLKLQNKIESEKGKLLQIYFNPENNNFNLTDSEKEGMKEINNQINNSDYLLIVKTITLVELIEFQFQVFMPKDSIGSNLNITNVKLIATEDLFINPKEKTYKRDIKNALQRLFKETNSKPIAELNFLGKSLKSKDTIMVPLNTQIELDGSNSGDFETENLTYLWRNIIPKNRKIQTTKKINFQENNNKQITSIEEDGHYKIGFSVYDNISNSNEVVINIKTSPKIQKLVIYDSVFTSNQYRTVKQVFTKHNQIHYVDNTASIKILNDTVNKNELVISKNIIDIKKNNIQDIPIEKKNISKNDYLYLKSNFLNDNPLEYYLYQNNELGFVSAPTKVIHKSKKFNFLSIGLKSSYSGVATDEPVDSTAISKTILAPKIDFNFAVIKNIELTLSFPFSTDNVDYLDENFNFPADITIMGKLMKYNISMGNSEIVTSYYLGGIFSLYSSNSIENEKDLKEFFTHKSIGLGGGGSIKLLRIKNFNFDLFCDAGMSYFIGGMSGLTIVEFNLGILYRLEY